MANEQEPVILTEDAEITTEQAEEGTLVEEIAQALFGEDEAAAEVTYADTDGDGKIDAGAVDTDDDGQLDTIAADTDGDGRIDSIAADTDGDGQLDVIAMDTDGDGVIDAAGEDTDGDGTIDTAYLDEDGDGEFEVVLADTDGDGEADEVTEASAGLPTDEEISTNSIEFTVGEDGFPVTDGESTGEFTEGPGDEFAVGAAEYQVGDTAYTAADTGVTSSEYSTEASSDPAADAEQLANADAAREAQAAADEFVAAGDYEAAAEARAEAEVAADAAGDPSIIESSDYTGYGNSDSAELENAAYKQEIAEEYRAQQAEHIAEGDYEAAKEDAQNAAYATGDADFQASGDDHTGQSDQDAYNLGNAVSEEKNADYFADNAEWYAEAGNPDAAQSSLENAGEYQASADNYAASADPVSPVYDVDPASAVETGGSYDAGGYDASVASVDTGMDASVETAPVTYDTTTDDTV